jgi:cytoskeleton protein RodZ
MVEGHSPTPRPQSIPGAGGEVGSPQPDSVGAFLKRLRIAKGASLDDIARATRVGRSHLEALEGGESGELPAPVFVKGFIRAYCEFLETKPDEALARYREHVGPTSAPARFGAAGRGGPSRLGSPIAVSLLLLAVLSGALIAVNLGLRSGGPKSAERPSAPAPATAAAPAAPAPAATPIASTATAPGGAPAAQAAVPPAAAPTAVEPTPAVPATPATSGQRLVVRALEATWVRVQMDRATAVEELLPVGAVREWSAQQDFVLTVGNAGGLELTLNGQRLPPLGDRGAVIRELVLPQHGTAPRS